LASGCQDSPSKPLSVAHRIRSGVSVRTDSSGVVGSIAQAASRPSGLSWLTRWLGGCT
jgi:hypothetical protein